MRVLLVSTHRADRGHYAPLARLLKADARFTIYFTSVWADWRNVVEFEPDMAVVLGDRFEMLGLAASFVEARIPVVHLHGGEHTYGSLDERWRWAITTIADVHCVAHQGAADSLYLWGVNPYKVYVTGAPGLDGITERGRPPFPHRALFLYNPVIDEGTSRNELMAIVEATGAHTPKRLFSLEESRWFAPNGDRYSMGRGDDVSADEFRDELAAATVLVGNSSAGIIEAPSLGAWTVNVGARQEGRVRADNVIDVPGEAGAIREAIRVALARDRYSGPNPYGDGHASERIREVLLGL